MSAKPVLLPMEKPEKPKSDKPKRKRSDLGVSDGEAAIAVLKNPATYQLASVIADPDRTLGGAPRTYPKYMFVVALSLADVFTSTRAAFTEMHGPLLWPVMRQTVAELFPDDPDMHLPKKPPCRTWYIKTCERNGVTSLADLQDKLTDTGIEAAVDQGLDIATPGQPIEVDLDRMVACDGKVITPITKYKKGDMRDVVVVDPETGEKTVTKIQSRHEPDAKAYMIGTGEQVVGVKTANISVAGENEHQRAVLVVDHVPGEKGEHNSEADILMKHLRILKQKAPGIVGPLADGILQGAHHQILQRELGMICISPIAAKAVDKKTGERIEKEGILRQLVIDGCPGDALEIHYYAGGLYKRVEFEEGSALEPLIWKRPIIIENDNGEFRSYAEYQAECNCGQKHKKTFTERTYNNDKDKKKGPKGTDFNRAENIRLIPPDFDVFNENYGQREEAESLNRRIDDHLYLRRARSYTKERQILDLIGHAHVVNSIGRYRWGKNGTMRHLLEAAEPPPEQQL